MGEPGRSDTGQTWRLKLVVVFAGVFLTTPAASGERLVFRAGGEVILPAVIQESTVTLEGPAGSVVFSKDDFSTIEGPPTPSHEWSQRVSRTNKATPTERFAEAWWALENGLTRESLEVAREIHRDFPDHGPSARLVRAFDRLTEPCPTPSLENARDRFPTLKRRAESPHFVLFHDAEQSAAVARLEVLERVLTGFQATFAAYGVELNPPREKQVGAFFSHRADYETLLKHVGAGAFLTTLGYYHPTERWVAAADATDHPTRRAEQEWIASRSRELQGFKDLCDKMPATGRLRMVLPVEGPVVLNRTEARTRLRAFESEYQRRLLLFEVDATSANLGTAAHETVHQLVAVTGLAPRFDAFPHWLHEGLAAQFEAFEGTRWAGLAGVNRLRQQDWERMESRPPLRDLIRDQGLGRGYQRDPYASAWAFVGFLREREPKRFLELLDELRRPGQSDGSHAAEGVLASGIDELQEGWNRFRPARQSRKPRNRSN